MQAVLPRATSVRVAFQNSARSHLRARSFRVSAMAAQPVFDIAVKGNPDAGILADCEVPARPLTLPRHPAAPACSEQCSLTLSLPSSLPAGPFCHRALLGLEEKHIPYSKTYIDFNNKPQWLLDVNPAGSVPVMKDLATGEWTVGSDVIVDLLEQRFPERSYGTVEGSPQVGNAIFGAFKDFAKAEGAEDAAAKEAALLTALEELEAHLAAGGPFIGGAEPCSTDLSLMPKLYHLETALAHFRGWELPARFRAVRAYLDAFKARDSWKKTHYSPELVIAGWERHGLVKK